MTTTSLSSDTRVRWEPETWVVRDHWWSRPRVVGAYLATHVAWPGAWGTGETKEAALDDLCDVIRGMASL